MKTDEEFAIEGLGRTNCIAVAVIMFIYEMYKHVKYPDYSILHAIMIGIPAIRNLIRENKVAQMYSAIQTGSALGMQTLDACLSDLVRRRRISVDSARAAAKIPENFF